MRILVPKCLCACVAVILACFETFHSVEASKDPFHDDGIPVLLPQVIETYGGYFFDWLNEDAKLTPPPEETPSEERLSLLKKGVCTGNFTLKYRSTNFGYWEFEAEGPMIHTLCELLKWCVNIDGSLYIDGNIGTGDGSSSLNHLGADVKIPNFKLLTSVRNDLVIKGGIHRFSGFPVLTSVGGNLVISGLSAMVKMSGMRNLTSVNGNLEISSNPILVQIEGFNKLSKIEGEFHLFNNQQLFSVIGFERLTTVKKGIVETGNYNLNQSTSITSLQKMGLLSTV